MATGALRVAMVGLGPKGLFALERLLDHAHRADHTVALDIQIFEPHPAPGAGPVYAPGQPDHLRMNIASDLLNMWGPGSRAVASARRLSYLDWRRANGPSGHRRERYPPRSLVGRYLTDGFAAIAVDTPAGVTLNLQTVAITRAQRRDDRWTMLAADGSVHTADELCVAVGHRAIASTDAVSVGSAVFIPAVFPVARWLSRERVPPGATVAIRGFALTFIDAALALTEGRGGAFEVEKSSCRLRYRPSADDVGVIAPFSRSGRPMLAKPEPERAAAPGLDDIGETDSIRILSLPEGFAFDDLLVILAASAGACVEVANGRHAGSERQLLVQAQALSWLRGAVVGDRAADQVDAAEEIRRSLEVGAGRRPPDLNWALGHAWRSLYPALVTRLSGAGLCDTAWPAFARLAREMERVAFGPPPVNAAKLLALVDAGRVDLTHVSGAHITSQDGITVLSSPRGARAVDVVVDAVLPGPGVRLTDGGLLAQLVVDGYARVVRGRRGLEVAADASCIDADGQATIGLAVLGRATEDWVIGNDTLNRDLHPHADLWARRIVETSAARTSMSSCAATDV